MSSPCVTEASKKSGHFVTLRRLLITAWLAFATIFVAGRVGSYGPNHGDVAIWIPMHEWMTRGATLYETVWDHKDWGFFWLSQPLYRLWGIEGLYFAGFLAVVALGAGVYLLVRPSMTPGGAASLAATGAVVYVSSPSFWSIFTENLGIGLVILAFGLLVRYPLLGGLTWSLAASVKVAGVGLFLLVLLGSTPFVYLNRDQSGRVWTLRWLVRALVGFLAGLVGVITLAAATGSLRGWLDVLSYNREYASSRGFPPDGSLLEAPFSFTRNAFLDVAQLGQHQLLFLMAMCVSVVGLSLLLVSQRRTLSHQAARDPSPVQLLFLTSLLVFGSLLFTLSQRPSPQHWQYFVGPGVLLACILYALLHSAESRNLGVMRVLGIGLLVLPLATSVLFDRTMLPRGILDRGIALTYFTQGGIFGEELASAPPESTIASFTINDERIDVSRLPPGSTLACPLIVQFPWYFPRYEQELLNCIESRPGLVVLGEEPWATESLREEITSVIDQEYELCARAGSTHELWARADVGCGFLDSSP